MYRRPPALQLRLQPHWVKYCPCHGNIYINIFQVISKLFIIHNNLAPVNGRWSNWGFYGKCSRTCGRGTKTRRRICNNPPPSKGGLSCRGSSVQTASCNPKPCSKFIRYKFESISRRKI